MVKYLAQYLEIYKVNGQLEVLLFGNSLVYTDDKLLGYYEGIKLVSNDGKGIGTILGNVDLITLGLEV